MSNVRPTFPIFSNISTEALLIEATETAVARGSLVVLYLWMTVSLTLMFGLTCKGLVQEVRKWSSEI